MKITVKAKALASGLSFVGRAAARQGGPAPHLSSVLFEADGESGLTTMRATDAEIAASLTSTAPKVDESGQAALSVRTLSDLIGRVDPGKEVALEATDNEATLTVEGTQNHYSLRTAKVGEFPPLPEFPSEDGHSFSLKARTLAEAIRRVSPAASTDDGRPVLTGLLFSFEAEGQSDGANGTDVEGEKPSSENASSHSTVLNVVATDSYRMIVSCERSEKVSHAPRAAIIPVRALKEASRLCAMGPERIDVALTDDSAFFRVGGVMLSTRLIAGSFPEYRRLLPEDEAFEHSFSVDAGELLEALYRVNLFAARQSPPVPVRLTFGAPRGLLTITVESEAVGSAVESLPAKPPAPAEADGGARQGTDGAESFEILFNPTYLTDAVKSCADAGGGADGSGGVMFCMKAPQKPAVLKPAPKETPKEAGDAGGAPEASLQCLVMPMADPRGK